MSKQYTVLYWNKEDGIYGARCYDKGGDDHFIGNKKEAKTRKKELETSFPTTKYEIVQWPIFEEE